MSSTQKYVGYSIVPWYNSAEWKDVYKLIFTKNSKNDDLKTALDIITLWQMRTPLLPSGVEGTLCILEALLIDNQELSERQYQILCASSVMRFLNICVASRAQVNNFTRTAKDNCIPDWIISIRHDFAHSQRLPSISILKLALKESFKWLENTYWKPELEVMRDNIISGANIESSLAMHELVGLYCNLFVYDAKHLCYDDFIQNQLEFVDASCNVDEYPIAILTLLEQGVQNLANVDWKRCLDEMTYSHWYIVSPTSLLDKNGTGDNNYLKISKLMSLVEQHNKISDLISELLYVTADDDELEENKLGAALWINEIFKGTIKLQKKTQKQKLSDLSGPGSGIHFTRVHKDSLDGFKQLEYRITNEIPEKFRKHFIYSYLLALDVTDVTRICKELNKRATISYDTANDTDDFLKMQNDEDAYQSQVLNLLKHLDDSDPVDVVMEVDVEENEKISIVSLLDLDITSSKRWSLVPDTSDFESCAIGVIPTQWF